MREHSPPHFRLYDRPNSPCDTLGINGGPWWTSAPEVSALGSEVRIAPNPAQDRVEFRFPRAFSGVLSLQDAQGRVVQQAVVSVAEGEPVPFEVSHLPAGVYYMQAVSEREVYRSQRIAVAR
ncbi:MAG: T9SS type A sorting domain-containing protein [Saprospiraceae bacterium]|nr:T9SS type A sorting domain-containing protein [Saprospiraceae bacterium]MDW8229920.1 T9SS type A sorting domain-containing protein [Saprospiraceae bacterium]